MKTNILHSTIAVLLSALPLVRAEEKSSSSSSSVTTNVNGTATITIEVNGKKETKTFKLGDGQPFTFKVEDGGAVASGSVGGGDGKQPGKQAPAKHEKVTWLGVATATVSDDLRAQLPINPGEGLSVTHVAPESPAAKAGIVEHDILLRFDDQILMQPDQLRALVKAHKPGDSVKLTYLRKGEQKDASVTLVEHEQEEQDDVQRWFGGFERGAGKAKEIQERLRSMKEKFPGIIVDKKSFLIGPDGVLKQLDGTKIEETLQLLRKQIEQSNINGEAGELIRKSLEEAIRNAKELLEKAEDAVKEKGAPAEKKEEKPQPGTR